MSYLLGIDVGTSSVKAAIVVAESARVVAAAGREVAIHTPRPGWAEQDPTDWFEAAVGAAREAIAAAGTGGHAVHGVGFSGQMHGTVCLDAAGRQVRPAIIWADTRSGPQATALLADLDPADLAEHAPGPPVAGFMGPTLRWLREHEPETTARTATVLLPKDYVRMRFTGEATTEVSDAASTWLLDIARGEWSGWLAERCTVEPGWLPPVLGSAEAAGGLRAEVAAALGVRPGIPIAAGCADQPAQALGHGLLDPGTDSVTIGTGGQVFHPLAAPHVDPGLRMHTFNHAVPGRWYALAAILSAGLSLRWLRDLLGMKGLADAYARLSALAEGVPPGAEGLIFLPYLAGERTPHMDPSASGVFLGLRLHHGPAHLARAVMEGVTMALAECLALASGMGDGEVRQVVASGGATNSAVWRQIQANVYGVPLAISAGEEHASLGAALLGGVAAGVYESVEAACARLPRPTDRVEPDPAAVAFYAAHREQFRALYGKLREDMHELIHR